MKSTTVILGLGSNLGDRGSHLRAGIRHLGRFLDDMRVSGIVESQAVLMPGSPKEWNIPYLNMAVIGKTALSPEQLLAEIKAIEQMLGRKPSDRWAPRDIDIDILAMEGVSLHNPALTIPHAELLNRDFALVPLAKLVPEWQFDGQAAKLIVQGKKFSCMPWRNTKLMGIVNITPDSFSDGGKNLDAAAALRSIEKLLADGADVIDIGAESTRPGATPLAHAEEWARLSPLLVEIKCFGKAVFSLDTLHAETVAKALDMGVHWINDVSGFSSPDMIAAVKKSDCKLVVMHSLSVPADKNIILPESADVMKILLAFAGKRLAELEAAGITQERIIFDPGIGFGKTAKQSRMMIDECRRLRELGVPLLYGHSRKSFLGAADRDRATLDVSRELAEAGIDYLRVHDVAAHKHMLKEYYG